MQPGSILGPYEIMEQLGAGGMGAVYRARDTRLGREVALKVILPGDTRDPVSQRRLLNEARAASALNHPNVVTVYEASSIDGVDFIAMELIVGETLASRIVRGRIPIQEAYSIAVQIAEGLSAAHQAGLIHRDLKPSNIMITLDGRAKILDFGLARKTEMAEPDAATLSMTLTVEGTVVGTVSYMSPEQARGEVYGPPSDIFTYGAVLYETLCGERPFEGKSQLDVFHQICFENPVPVTTRRPDTPPALAAIVSKALAKKPADRFTSMAGVVDVLRMLVVSGSQVAFAPTNSGTAAFEASVATDTAGPKPWRNRALVALGVIAALAAAAEIYRLERTQPAVPVGDATLSKITYDAGLTGYSAISRDGKLVAYASDRLGGNLDIWVQSLSGGKPSRLTSDAADDYSPDFSPDGNHIAYHSDRQGGGVYITPTSSTAEELLLPGGFDPKYSPDGNTVANWRGYVGGAFYPGAAQIVLVPLGTRKPQIFRPDFETAAYPVWLSNSRLLFLGRKKGIVDWWVADIGGGEAIETGAFANFRQAGLKLPPAAYWFRPEVQSGGDILFTATRGDATNVWQARLDPAAHVTAPPAGVTFGASLDSSVGVAESGNAGGKSDKKIVFSSLSLANNVWKLPLSAAGTAESPPERLIAGEPHMAFPTVSVDGRTLLVSVREASGYRIVSVDLNTMRRATITDATASHNQRNPLLSGDGTHIVFIRGASAYLTTVEDGPVYLLLQNCGKLADTSFDASQVLCESAGADEKLLLWSRTSTRTLVSQPDGRNSTEFQGHFSPDARWVVYSEGKQSSPSRQIVIVPNAPERKLAASEWITISDGGDSDRSPVWAPDGKHIYYISDRDGFTCLWARPVDPATARPTGPSFALAHFHLAAQTLRMTMAGELSLSASRNFLVFTLGEMTGNVWMKEVRGDSN